MRAPRRIKIDIEVEEANLKLARLKLNDLKSELFHAENYLVSWSDAENYFIENLVEPITYPSKRPEVKNLNWYSEDISIKENREGNKVMFIGGYENNDRHRRGEPLYVSREFEGLIPAFNPQ